MLFDQVLRKAIEWDLRVQDIRERLIRLVMCLYKDSKTEVCAACGLSDFLYIKTGVRQGSTLCLLLSVLV